MSQKNDKNIEKPTKVSKKCRKTHKKPSKDKQTVKNQ